jgi:hypothetical protein
LKTRLLLHWHNTKLGVQPLSENLLQLLCRVNMTEIEPARRVRAGLAAAVRQRPASSNSSRKQAFLLPKTRVSTQVKVT